MAGSSSPHWLPALAFPAVFEDCGAEDVPLGWKEHGAIHFLPFVAYFAWYQQCPLGSGRFRLSELTEETAWTWSERAAQRRSANLASSRASSISVWTRPGRIAAVER